MKIFEDLDLYLFFNHKKNIFMINQINFLWAHFSCIWGVPSETVIFLIFVYFTFWFLLLLFNKKYLICRFIWILDWATGCAKSAMRLVFGPNQSQSLFEVQKKEDKIVMGLSSWDYICTWCKCWREWTICPTKYVLKRHKNLSESTSFKCNEGRVKDYRDWSLPALKTMSVKFTSWKEMW